MWVSDACNEKHSSHNYKVKDFVTVKQAFPFYFGIMKLLFSWSLKIRIFLSVDMPKISLSDQMQVLSI